jgi:flagellar hook-basal body complex protein FliE
MSDMQIQNVLAQMRALSARAANGAAGADGAAAAQRADFAALLKQSLDEVNAAQHDASRLATRFEQGAPEVSLAEVMVSTQKASLQFEAVTQVRNRLIAAYQEIMNMQV